MATLAMPAKKKKSAYAATILSNLQKQLDRQAAYLERRGKYHRAEKLIAGRSELERLGMLPLSSQGRRSYF